MWSGWKSTLRGAAQCRHSLGEHLQMELQEQVLRSSSIPCLQSPVCGEAGGQAGLERDTDTLTGTQTLSQEAGGSPGWEIVLFRGICSALQLIS